MDLNCHESKNQLFCLFFSCIMVFSTKKKRKKKIRLMRRAIAPIYTNRIFNNSVKKRFLVMVMTTCAVGVAMA